MPRQALTTVENNFTGGLKTEFTGLNFPENSVFETSNIIYDRLGRVQRRRGIDLEDTGTYATIDRTSGVVASYVWLNAAGDGVTNLVVVQVGTTLRFYEASDPSTALSGQLLASSINLTTFAAAGTSISSISDECQFAQGNGFLFVFHSHLEPFYVTYDPVTQVLAGNVITVEIRDLAGINEGIADTTRPTVLTDIHRYNLGNQGWRSGFNLTSSTSNSIPGAAPASRTFTTNLAASATPIRNGDRLKIFSLAQGPLVNFMTGVVTSFSGTSLQVNVTAINGSGTFSDWQIVQNPDDITTWFNSQANYPSNADIWWAFKNASGVFDMATINNIPLATAAAPKGHYVVSAFNIDRSTVSGISGLTAVTTGGERPSTGTFHAGRVFYAGIKTVMQHNNIYFSQIVEGTSELGRCYQQNDPSAEDFFDLLPSDGGVITVQGAGTILKLFSTKSALICFATNGVWAISGSQDSGLGFNATDYNIIKLSAIKTLSHTSFVEAQNTISWWNLEGIYTLQLGDIGGAQGAQIQSMTNTTIASFYNTIPNASKQYARGYYNPLSFIVQWIYRSNSASTIEERYEYDSFLCFNVLSQAFYTYSVATSNSGITINGIATVETPGGTFLINNVVRGADNVVDLSGNQVIVNALSGNVTPIFKYIISKPNGATWSMSFAEEFRSSYHDWVSEDTVGRDYESTFTTGYSVHGEAQKFFELNYLNVYTDTSVDDSDTSYFIQGKWDFSNSGNSGKWSTQQRALIPAGNFAVDRRRFRIRGKGMSLQLKFTAIESFPMTLIGWSKWETKNPTP